MSKDRRKGRQWLSRRGPVRAAGVLATALSLLTASVGVLAPTPAEAAPIPLDQGGSWGPVEDWPMVAIHAALDPNGRVVTYGTNPNGLQTGRFIYDIWTPGPAASVGHRTLTNTTRTDLFCSLQLNRADSGDLIIFGGDNWTGAGTNNRGNPDITQISATTGEITQLPGMNRSRWYATGTTLPDGSIYVQGGLDGEDRPEHWSAESGAELLDLDTSDLGWYYPRNFVAPNGQIFGIADNGWMYWVSEELDSIDVVGRLPYRHRGSEATAVMFEPGRILYFGGRTAATIVIDVTAGGAPVVTAAGQLSSVRYWVDGTLLPDGRVLASGGSVKNSSEFTEDPINSYGVNRSTEIWDPRTGQWTVGESAQMPRLYHSTALLLPDGRVLTAGGGSPGPIINTDAEIYSPDYLLTATGQPTPRLEILGLSTAVVSAGASIDLAVSSAPDVARVTLVKSGSVTHSFNMDQRFVELGFTTTGDAIRAQLPVNDAAITPGYYLLSVLDENDIPSVSQMIRVTPPDPAQLRSTVDGEVLRLYRAYFQRDPEPDGYRFWRRQRLTGLGLVEISQAFAQSGEFTTRYGNLSDADFVDRLYLNVLGRPADVEGQAYWVQVLQTGATRGAIMVAFSESDEFVDRTGTADLGAALPIDQTANPAPNPAPSPAANPAAAPAPGPVEPAALHAPEIRRLYLGYFLREPDADGLAHWTQVRAGGTGLIAVSDEFALSPEFQNRYGQADDPAFVDLVYGNVLGRPADPEGRSYWLAQLGAGLTRGEVMVGFTESPEFIAATGG